MTVFTSRVAIVTGGSSGIGKEVASRFAQAAGAVVIGGREADKLTSAAQEIDPTGANAAILVGDIANPETCGQLVEKAEEVFGGVDVLFNNAGVFRPKPFLDLTFDEYDWFLADDLERKVLHRPSCRESYGETWR